MNYSAIHLRALEPSDLDFLFALENDQRLWTVSNTLVPFSKFTLKEYIAHVKDDIFTAKQQRFVISDAQNSALGLIDLYEFDPVHHRAGVGLVIAETLRGNGLGKKALALIDATSAPVSVTLRVVGVGGLVTVVNSTGTHYQYAGYSRAMIIQLEAP